MTIIHSRAPEIVGQFDITCPEFMFAQYMPIAMPNWISRVPEHLKFASALLGAVSAPIDAFIYLTAKCMYVGPGCAMNRPGWHIDGYGTDDINYIWSDCVPTEFCVQSFDLSADHEQSMVEMTQQARHASVVTFPDRTLLKLDNTMVHRVGASSAPVLRTFVKISISRERYNLRGNAHNHLLDYDWPMVDRQASRNHPIGA